MATNVQLGPLTPTIMEPVAAPGAATGVSVAAPSMATSSPAALLMIAQQVGEGLKAKSAGLDYHVDMVSGMPRIRIIDRQTMQIIRQIPSDEVLTIHRALEGMAGVLVSDKV
ncbi:MAG: flagellar protein FlaG [Georgfuchsia sp.]